jgi:hypothetical protein
MELSSRFDRDCAVPSCLISYRHKLGSSGNASVRSNNIGSMKCPSILEIVFLVPWLAVALLTDEPLGMRDHSG